MSDLNPRGVKVQIGGEEHELLFTINVIDEIQSVTGLPLFDAMDRVAHVAYSLDSQEDLRTFRSVLSILIKTNLPNDARIEEKELGKRIIWNEVSPLARSIVEAFGISLPEPDDEDENEEDPKENPGA